MEIKLCKENVKSCSSKGLRFDDVGTPFYCEIRTFLPFLILASPTAAMCASSSEVQQTVSPQATNPWIVNWWQDLLWFIGPPILLVPLFYGLLQKISLSQLSLLVVTLGAVGHHLPGMIRAYGDSDLFVRYRVRFIVAPVFLVAVSVFYSFYRPDALGLVVVTWGFWHSQAQVYGFLRIYDSKVGLTDQPSAWADRLLCLSWFGGGILMSEGRVTDFLKVYYSTGGYPIDPAWISGLRSLAMGLMGISVVLYLIKLVRQRAEGRHPSPVKMIALVLSIGFWWYCMVGIRNVVLGVAMYEVFHDVQYLAIVWFFNRRRAESGPSAGWVTRTLFRPRMRLVFVYVGLVLAYGAGSLLTKSLEVSTFQTVLTGLFAASGLLHFYYDGFIWRIRDKSTSDTLGVENRTTVARLLGANANLRHASLWALFVVPLVLFTLTPERSEIHGEVVRTLPESAEAHLNYASWLRDQGDFSGAEKHLEQARTYHPDWWKIWSLQGELELARGQADDALKSLQRALEQEPLDAVTQFNLGDAYLRLGRIEEGIAAYQTAAELNPDFETNAFNNLGMALLQGGDAEEAENAFRQSLESDPSNLNARMNLALSLSLQEQTDDAIAVYEDILRNRPDYRDAYTTLIQFAIFSDRLELAEEWTQTFRQQFSQDPDSHALWGQLQLKQKHNDEAIASFSQALQIDPGNFKARLGLAQLEIARSNYSTSLAMLADLEQLPELSPMQRRRVQQLRRQIMSQSP
ncbi:MAG: tetratricopeptide repeat protein [Planctomycetaceae bacterium]|nr:tetratricopeptide repeat protein [Planctomycetaceae bacterium]